MRKEEGGSKFFLLVYKVQAKANWNFGPYSYSGLLYNYIIFYTRKRLKHFFLFSLLYTPPLLYTCNFMLSPHRVLAEVVYKNKLC